MAELQRKEQEIARFLNELQHQQEVLHRLSAGDIAVKMMPAAWFLRRVPDEASAATEAERNEIISARNDEKQWTLSMPFMSLCRCYCRPDGQTVHDMFGAYVTDSAARAYDLPLKRAVYLPEQLCISAVTEARLGAPLPVQHIFDYAQTNGYRVCADVYAIVCLNYRNQQRERWAAHEIRMPVVKI